MASRSSAGAALHHFITDIGIPDVIIVDNAPEQTGTNSEFLKVCRQYKIQHRQTEPYMPCQNQAELSIQNQEEMAHTDAAARSSMLSMGFWLDVGIGDN